MARPWVELVETTSEYAGKLHRGRLHSVKLAHTKSSEDGTEIMIHQLRIYEIFEYNKSAFHARFRDHAMHIMQKYGFEIVAMWEARNEQKTEFVYLLTWPDEITKSAAWSKFMADEEWKEVKRVTSAQYGDMVGSIEDRVLFLTDYSAPYPQTSQKNRQA